MTTPHRPAGVIGLRLSRARQLYWCDSQTAQHCQYSIHPGNHYWRYYGRMADARDPFTVRECVVCHLERGEPSA